MRTLRMAGDRRWPRRVMRASASARLEYVPDFAGWRRGGRQARLCATRGDDIFMKTSARRSSLTIRHRLFESGDGHAQA